MTTPRITIRHIADDVGLHFTTVALALRNSPKIRQATREKIQASAARLGYRPDPALTALNAYRKTVRSPHYQATLAWLNNWPRQEDLLANDTFREYFEGANARARELGYRLETFWLHEEGLPLPKLGRVLKARGIQGLLLAPQPNSELVIDFDFAGFSAVSFGYSLLSPALHVVTSHNFRNMWLMLSHLEALGYRRIGLRIDKGWDKKVGFAYWGCARAYEDECKHPLEIIRMEASDQLLADIEKLRPDVIVSHTAIYEKLRMLGVRIPRDVAFANLDTRRGGDVAGICQNSLLIGRKAVDILVGMLHGGETGVPEMPLHLLVDSTWQSGPSLPDRNKAAWRNAGV
ncbi:LacI family transcriptional regulator [Opitutaceae bacterium TAV4]|uniref:LacI family DNA-binding transcriptional regulator n=1 Tax=Geminisphaera colitermitum TaxID=1148786 RepID=UPI000158C869|nr:LacI family DNA-binding transcriptional regulator [Geminisphaera colitermitum]RRJ94770.1 LacI family transcriptional regulator [Opitutaceae bacterium TAV4]RRJ98838.1 LacI family transcriptional regulator [Opitutaceae bacterium TAV3]